MGIVSMVLETAVRHLMIQREPYQFVRKDNVKESRMSKIFQGGRIPASRQRSRSLETWAHWWPLTGDGSLIVLLNGVPVCKGPKQTPAPWSGPSGYVYH